MRSGLKRAAVGLWMWMVFAAVSTGCFGCAAREARPSEPKIPDTTGIIRLVGRYSVASGCPVGPREVITNAHVIDPRPFDPTAPTTPMMFQQGDRFGILMPNGVATFRDIAEMKLREADPDLAMYYSVSKVAPHPGDLLYFMGFDWSGKEEAFAPKMFTAKLLRIVAGHLVYEPAGEPGTSGSCVLNADGEVVGINAWIWGVGFQRMQGVGVGSLYIEGTR